LEASELSTVEAEVNTFIRQNAPVDTRIMTPDDARAIGAQALFGEKYGDEVRVVSMGKLTGSGKGSDANTYSLELCGGTHVARTGDIGAFVLLGDSASSSGVRRIEALTGEAALAHLRLQEGRLVEVANLLKAPVAEIVERVKSLSEERRALVNEVSQLKRDLAMGGGSGGGVEAVDVNGIKMIAQVLTGVSGKDLPTMVDAMKEKLGSGVVLLIADTGAKPAVAAGVTADLTANLSAVDVLRAAVAALGGKGGGGRPDLAQGGGVDISAADDAIKAAQAVLGG